MTAIRSASRSASSRYWVVSSTVVPSATSASIASQSAMRLRRSRPVVGSSRKSTGGRATSAAARSRRRRIRRSTCGRAGRRRRRGRRRRAARARARASAAAEVVEPADHLEVLEAGQVLVDGGVLAGEPDALADLRGLADDVEARDARRAAVRREQRRQDPDRGRLAGAVRAEQPEDGPGLDPRGRRRRARRRRRSSCAARGLDRVLAGHVTNLPEHRVLRWRRSTAGRPRSGYAALMFWFSRKN